MADKGLIYMVKSIGPNVIAALDNTSVQIFYYDSNYFHAFTAFWENNEHNHFAYTTFRGISKNFHFCHGRGGNLRHQSRGIDWMINKPVIKMKMRDF